MATKYLFQNQNERKEGKAMNKKVLLLVVTAMMVIAGNVWAADANWVGTTSTNWSTASNWSPASVPGLSDKAKINNSTGNSPTISGTAAVNQLYVAESNNQTLTVSGSLSVNAETVLGGISGDGKLLVSGGTVECNNLFVGFDPNATGRLQIDSGDVNVVQMFGLSWNGGNGYARLTGGLLHTEQFAFEYAAGGTADMNITGGTWIQEHFWWDKIRALVWYGKIKGYGGRANVVVTWDPTAGTSGQTTVTAVAESNTPSFYIVKQNGTGEYTTIQAALNAAAGGSCRVIEVQDSCVYQQNLVFPADANYLTLQAGSNCSPTIILTGAAAETNYIDMRAVGQTIQGFNINCPNDTYATDNNSFLIHASGGATTVRDCNIVGSPNGYIRGIAGVATIEDVELSKCTIGILCDANETRTGFRYSISGSHIYDHRIRGVLFSDSNAVMDDCLVERCGNTTDVGGNVIADGNDGTLNLLITHSVIREAIYGRNFNMEDTGTATIEDSIIMNALGTFTHSDEILQYRGTLNLNRCIIKAGQRMCVNMTQSGLIGGTCNIDHCDFYDPNLAVTGNDQWALTTTGTGQVLNVKNSILTGDNGYLRNAGTFNSNWNDNFCTNRIGGGGSVVLGPNDINLPGGVGVNPQYIQTSNPNEPNFFKLQPYSPVRYADEDGNYMGSQGVLYGQEAYPADLISPHGVDFKDFATFASNWRKNNTISAIPQLVLETFETYDSNAALLASWQEVPRTTGVGSNWENYPNAAWLRGSSTITLLTDPCEANSPSKAMRWVYDVNLAFPEANNVRYTEIMLVLPSEVNFTPYNELRVSLKRHAGNSPDTETFMCAKFLNDIYNIHASNKGLDNTAPDKRDIANSVIGGSTALYPGVYYDWTINFDNLAGWTWGHNNLNYVGAIIFGIQSQPTIPHGLGKGTIDVDDIRLVDRPGCSGNPVGDFDGNCIVNFADVDEFANYWLMGK